MSIGQAALNKILAAGEKLKTAAKRPARKATKVTKDFLLLSSSYKRDIDPSIQKRRGIVVGFCNNEYRAPFGWVSKALATCKREGLNNVNEQMLKDDLYLYRTTYLWLHGDAKTWREYKATKGQHPRFTGIKHFVRDGIDSWEALQLPAASVKPKPPTRGAAAKPVKAAKEHKQMHLWVDGKPVHCSPTNAVVLATLRVLSRAHNLTLEAEVLYRQAEAEMCALTRDHFRLVKTYYFTNTLRRRMRNELELKFMEDGRVHTVRWVSYKGKPVTP